MNKKKLIAIIAAVIAVVIAVSVIFIVKNKNNTDEEETTTEVAVVENTTIEQKTESEDAEKEPEAKTEAQTNRKTVRDFVVNDLGFVNPVITEGHKVQNGTVYFVDEPGDESEIFFKNRYIIVDTGKRFVIKELFRGVGDAERYFVDVDGEKGEEIVVHMNTGGNGGYGIYVSYVFRVDEEGIWTLYDSEDKFYNLHYKEVFKSRLEAPFKAVVYCDEINLKYEKTLDLTDWGSSDKKYLFDKEGNPIVDYAVDFDGFYKFEPKDIDKDGVYEIECRQYASLGSHVSGVGYAQLILSFDEYLQIESAKFTEGSDEEFLNKSLR